MTNKKISIFIYLQGIDCLRNIDFETIIQMNKITTSKPVSSNLLLLAMPWSPTIDSVIFKQQPFQTLIDGDFDKSIGIYLYWTKFIEKLRKTFFKKFSFCWKKFLHFWSLSKNNYKNLIYVNVFFNIAINMQQAFLIYPKN